MVITYCNKLKVYDDSGQVKSSVLKQICQVEFKDVTKMFAKYMEFCAEKCKRDKCGAGWTTITTNNLTYAKIYGYME